MIVLFIAVFGLVTLEAHWLWYVGLGICAVIRFVWESCKVSEATPIQTNEELKEEIKKEDEKELEFLNGKRPQEGE